MADNNKNDLPSKTEEQLESLSNIDEFKVEFKVELICKHCAMLLKKLETIEDKV